MSSLDTAGIQTSPWNPAQPCQLAKKPYYYDSQLDIRMFRGPGYERFPVALGTVPGHQQFCDEWDDVQKIKIRRAPRGLPAFDEGEQPEILDSIIAVILNILPGVDFGFVRTMTLSHLQDIDLSAPSFDAESALEKIILEILETNPDLPTPQKSSEGEPAPDGTGVTIAWKRDLAKDPAYLHDAAVFAALQFPCVPTDYIHVHELESQYDSLTEPPYHRRQAPRAPQNDCTTTFWWPRNEKAFPEIVNELQAAKQHVAREALKLERQKEKAEAEAANLEAHRASGKLVVCQCCFDDEIPTNRAVPCQGATPVNGVKDIHFFCFGCVTKLAGTQIGLMRYEMQCMDCGGCKAALSKAHVKQAIPTKTMAKLAFNQQQAEVAAANIKGLEQCPFCDFKGVCDPVDVEQNFYCQNPDCVRVTCRLCKSDAHSAKTCEEVQRDKGLSALHIVEEARTEALVRTCPHCKVKIIKELGCNKIKCTNCNFVLCYVCRADISQIGYDHFFPRQPESKCVLFQQAGAPPLHDRDADKAEEQAIQELEAQGVAADPLRINTAPRARLLPGIRT